MTGACRPDRDARLLLAKKHKPEFTLWPVFSGGLPRVLLALAGLLQGVDAASAGFDLRGHAALKRQRRLLDVGLEHTVCLGRPACPSTTMLVLNATSKHRRFTTNSAFCHGVSAPSVRAELLRRSTQSSWTIPY